MFFRFFLSFLKSSSFFLGLKKLLIAVKCLFLKELGLARKKLGLMVSLKKEEIWVGSFGILFVLFCL
jgi:hypothetical protein